MLAAPVGLQGIISTFGDLTPYIADDGIISETEEANFLTTFELPFYMKYAFDTKVTIKRIKCHKLIVEPLLSVFNDIKNNNLDKYCLEYGGCYNYRKSRTSNKLSTHSWGIAIDLNPNTNQLGNPRGDMNKDVVTIFKKYGFTWGGDFKSTADRMHFQFCSGY